MKASTGGVSVACIGFVVACWLVLSWPWLSGSVTIPYDAKAHFQPQLAFLAHAIHAGVSPFWNPHVFGGSPQIADPQSLIFSPAAVLALLDADPSFRAFDTYVFLLLLGGAVSVVMFFRDRGWHAAGATVAALSFAFGASAAWRVQHIKQIQSFAIFALSLWLFARALDRGGIRNGAAAGVGIGLMIASADQVAMLCGYFLGGYAIWQIMTAPHSREAMQHAARALISCFVVAAAVAVVPILLTYEFVGISNRPDIPFSIAVRGSLHPTALLTAFIGDLYSASDLNYWGPSSGNWHSDGLTLSQNMYEIYSGSLISVGVLGMGIVRGYVWRADIRYFTIALVIATFYALGWYTPIFTIFYDYLPFVHLFRRPADATFLMGAFLSIVGGYVVHAVATETGSSRFWRQDIGSGLVIIACFAAAYLIAFWKGHLGQAMRPLALSVGLAAVAFAMLIVLPRLARVSPLASAIVAGGFLAIDLALINGPNTSTAWAPSKFPMLVDGTHEPTVEFLRTHLDQHLPTDRRDRIELLGLGFEWPNAGMVHRFDHVLGYNPLRLSVVSTGIGAGDTIAEPQQRRFTALFPSYRSMLANLLGLRYIASKEPIERIDKKLRANDLPLVAQTDSAFIYENINALPRVIFAPQWRRADFSAIIRTGQWPVFDPRRTVLLDTASAAGREVQEIGNPPTQALVAITRYANTVIDIDVRSQSTGFVVLNDIYHPWWHATVDGVETPIFEANVMFRAVAVPAGHHDIRFTFEPLRGLIAQLLGPLVGTSLPIVPKALPRLQDAPLVVSHSTVAADRAQTHVH